jgi:4-amino-4-deoxy-L-arabinose transferase-like glycosyltransferase
VFLFSKNFRQKLKDLLKLPSFWIVLFLLIRFYGITNPPLEVSHNWRQTTGLMVARNFVEVNNNIFYPQIDITSGKSGIIGMEFPLLNYFHYLLATLFGYEHWYGRLINLIISSLGIFFYSKIIEQWTNRKTALYSTLALLASIWFAFSRKMMPDTFSISLAIIGIYYINQYLKTNSIKHYGLGILLFSLGLLAKIPAGIYIAPLLMVLISKRLDKKFKLLISLGGAFSLLLVFLWYFIWNPYLEFQYGNWYNSGFSIKEGFMEISSNMGAVLKNFYFNTFQSYILFALSIAGLFLLFRNKEKNIILIVISILLTFIIYIIKSGFFFHHHNYYIIPIVPVFAFLVGYLLSAIQKKYLAITLISLGIIEAIANQSHDFRLKESNLYKLRLETIMDTFSSSSDLIAINTGGNPQQLYLSHRKGWVFESEEIILQRNIEYLKNKDCKFMVLDKNLTSNRLPLETIFEDEDYLVYQLN